jgi:cytoskeletal protein CcmA (bactofilin family)
MALYGTGSNVNQTTDVSAGNYGSASAIPVITVDSDKRISAINTAAITLDASVNANASVGDVGTYAFLQQSGTENSATNPGSTVAGSTLRYSDATGRKSNDAPSGNWRCMGYDSGAALVNSGSGTGSGSGSGNVSANADGNLALSGGNVQGNTSLSGGNLDGNLSGNLSGGNIDGNTNVNVSGNIQGGKGGSFNVNSGVPTDNLAVGGSVDVGGDNTTISGNVSTENLSVAGNIPTDNLTINGTASVNVTVNSVTVNTTVAYSATLWLRYS